MQLVSLLKSTQAKGQIGELLAGPNAHWKLNKQNFNAGIITMKN